jgi:UDP-N-acetylglucosamine 2-epimerase (non-hydrolysing)
VLSNAEERIASSDVLSRLGLEARTYFLATFHRAETVDREARLRMLVDALEQATERHGVPMVVSLHPRTRDRLTRLGVAANRLRLMEPLGFFDFVALERSARAVLSDSGTVQEECAIFRVPNVTIRDVTERPETIECGSNILSGAAPDDVLRALNVALTLPSDWTPPPEYVTPDVSAKVVKIVLGFTSWRRHGSAV